MSDAGKVESPAATVIASDGTWIEGEAVRQLERTAELPGMRRVVGMPDLHPGKGTPIGAVFIGARVYPHLVGNDIGCGMALWQTSIRRRKLKLDRWLRRLDRDAMEGPWDGDVKARLDDAGVATDDEDQNFTRSLGTIGGGNHFAELQVVDEVLDADAWDALGVGLDKDRLFLLVHSGSRGLGQRILREHVDEFAAVGLAPGTDDCDAYIARHDRAVAWARVNRAVIAERFADALGARLTPVLDICHNSVLPGEDGGDPCWLHRKGAAPQTEGPVVIPGSRGARSYLVQPKGDGEAVGYSLAHGAGRKWKRSDAKGRLRKRYRPEDLERTAVGGRVICEDKDLLYEEAPEAYKNIDTVVADLVEAGAASIVATLRPLITYKTRRR